MNVITIMLTLLTCSLCLGLLMERAYFDRNTLEFWQKSKQRFYLEEGILFYSLALLKQNKLKQGTTIYFEQYFAYVALLTEGTTIDVKLIINNNCNAFYSVKKNELNYEILSWELQHFQ